MTIPENFDIEERARKAKQNFLDGYNCCQSVMLAFSDVFEADELALSTIASGFGGGLARMREVCGTVSAIGMAAGFISPAVHPKNMEERTANYALVQELAGEFRKENGSIICAELLGLRPKKEIESPAPSERTEEYYRKRPCPELVACSARIIARKLLSMQNAGATALPQQHADGQ
ncbi:MAG: C_GCAxxG_C_C family protein [Bacteroidetes bacterium]|uniref:C_GCAxxG_C_C family protein n=1 Tax=Candidatus Cryptobacteroides intestinavium TaxID=2840766 RepID=A0A9D9ET69_9BACT|nr:C_GCAxxG_C_C family protein [Candidatus Cryptobacteroides intestinavium]